MEYQAKQLFAKHGVPVTVGTVITEPAEAAAIFSELESKAREELAHALEEAEKSGALRPADAKLDPVG